MTWMAPKSAAGTGLLVFAILAVALLLRVIHLDADSSALISRDFITDEGWWTHNARNRLFYGQFRMDEYNLGFYSSPLYMAMYLALAFKHDSPVQHPEGLYRDAKLMIAVTACAVLMAVLLFVDIPLLHKTFVPTLPTP